MPSISSLLTRLRPGLLPWIDVLGYAASLLVLTTFCINTMLRLRWVAIGSNILFMLFGYLARIYPVMILHVILFPVNFVRLVQIYRLVQSAVNPDGDADCTIYELSERKGTGTLLPEPVIRLRRPAADHHPACGKSAACQPRRGVTCPELARYRPGPPVTLANMRSLGLH